MPDLHAIPIQQSRSPSGDSSDDWLGLAQLLRCRVKVRGGQGHGRSRPGSEVRTGLPAGASRIRTPGPTCDGIAVKRGNRAILGGDHEGNGKIQDRAPCGAAMADRGSAPCDGIVGDPPASACDGLAADPRFSTVPRAERKTEPRTAGGFAGYDGRRTHWLRSMIAAGGACRARRNSASRAWFVITYATGLTTPLKTWVSPYLRFSISARVARAILISSDSWRRRALFTAL